ncbi:MAG: transcriptional regulator [Chloroflexota bacterium]
MRTKPRKPSSPLERRETVRQQIISVLEGATLSAREISALVKVAEKEVYEHLTHIQRQLWTKQRALVVVPAECRRCGFQFRKRGRLTKPGRCPVCRGESVREPAFTVKGPDSSS